MKSKEEILEMYYAALQPAEGKKEGTFAASVSIMHRVADMINKIQLEAFEKGEKQGIKRAYHTSKS